MWGPHATSQHLSLRCRHGYTELQFENATTRWSKLEQNPNEALADVEHPKPQSDSPAEKSIRN